MNQYVTIPILSQIYFLDFLQHLLITKVIKKLVRILEKTFKCFIHRITFEAIRICHQIYNTEMSVWCLRPPILEPYFFFKEKKREIRRLAKKKKILKKGAVLFVPTKDQNLLLWTVGRFIVPIGKQSCFRVVSASVFSKARTRKSRYRVSFPAKPPADDAVIS